jgi:single-strand DNA-binding protein
VSCWRTLADHVVASVHKGDPVVVAGRLRVREWTDGDRQGTHVDIEARSVGHDLSHGVTRFERLRRMSAIADGGAPAPDARELADVDADAGACASGPVSDPGDASAA